MTVAEAPLPSNSLPSKEVVLEAAQRLLLQYGYAGLSMRELAKQSGLAKGTIYHHFPDKRAILLSVLERDIAIARQHIEAAAAGEDGYAARLRRVIATFFQLQQERRLLILLALRDAAGRDPQVCALLRRYRQELVQPIAAIFAEAIAAGEMRPVNAEMTAVSLLGILQGFVAQRMLLGDAGIGDDVISDDVIGDDVIDHTLDLLLCGVLRPPPPVESTSNTQPG
ncbi:MAG: TetR/AcrR family transcriptional regulator [Caldilineaceae bacterium]|nr:TetR/AcrR family transcriptional regulator [Caldilineaceae bacterium]